MCLYLSLLFSIIGTGVDVYILDTGIHYCHQVYKGRVFSSYDQFGGNGADCHGHGTHCAGLAVGRLTGVAWGARVYRYCLACIFYCIYNCSVNTNSM